MPRTEARRTRRTDRPGPLLEALALLVVVAALPRPAVASEPDPPSEPALDAELLTTLRGELLDLDRSTLSRHLGTESASAERCRVEPKRWTCRELRVETAQWHLEFDRWQRGDASGTEVRGLRARHVSSGRIVAAGSLQTTDNEVRARALRIAAPTGEGVSAERISVGARRIEVSTVRWLPLKRRRGEGAWGEIPDLLSGGPSSLRARRALYRNGEWRFEQLVATDPVSLPVGPVSGERPAPATGLVPPTLTYSADRLEALQRAHHGPTGIGLSASAAPGAWYGLGPMLVGRLDREWPALRSEGPPLLDTHLLYDARSNSLEGAAVGELRYGAPYLHASGDFEEVTRDQYWRTRRMDGSALFRPWRRSSLGAALSGSRHHFQVRAAHWAPYGAADGAAPRSHLPQSAPESEEAELQLRFGTDTRIGDRFELSTDIFHRNRARAGERDDHGSLLIAAASGDVGRPGRLFGEAQLASLVGTTLAPPNPGEESDGFQAAPVTQFLAGLRGGLTLRGDLPAATHLVRPSIHLYREVAGRGSATGPSSPYAAPFTRIPRWTLAGFVADQTLRWPSFEIGLPVTLLADGDGFEKALSSPATLSARLRLAWTRIQLRSGIAAPTDFATADTFASAAFEQRPWSLSVGATTLQPAETGRLYADEILPHAAATLRLLEAQRSFQREPPGPVLDALVPFFQADWDGGAHRVETSVFAEGPISDAGVSLGWTRRFRRMGWGLGVEGATTVPTGNWGVTAGLRRSGSMRGPGGPTW